MNYEVDIAGYKKSLKLFKVSDDLQIAAFILYGDVAVTQHAAKELLARAPERSAASESLLAVNAACALDDPKGLP